MKAMPVRWPIDPVHPGFCSIEIRGICNHKTGNATSRSFELQKFVADQHDDGCHSKVADYQAQSQGGPQTGLAEKLYGLVYLRVMPTRQADQVRQPGMREGRFGG